MPLEVIGAGWGRTGTSSTKQALELLGYTCHHMSEVDDDPSQQSLFLQAAVDSSFDWNRIYARYTATVDWPGCAFWRELRAAYPEARVLLNVRDFDDWYGSWHATIRNAVTGQRADHPASWLAMADAVIVGRSLRGTLHGREHVRAAFHEHVRAVTTEVPRDLLLVYDVTQGWEPLCRFLGKTLPDVAFPHVNVRDEWCAATAASEGSFPSARRADRALASYARRRRPAGPEVDAGQ